MFMWVDGLGALAGHAGGAARLRRGRAAVRLRVGMCRARVREAAILTPGVTSKLTSNEAEIGNLEVSFIYRVS